ncbi:MAG TPA: AI-2E family transporter [Pseudohaliea sp.]|nr:AI-2E family transporter [Pseudohaliea sp.]
MTGEQRSGSVIETVVQVTLLGLLALACAHIVSPFASLLLWALILAVTLNPLNDRLAGVLGGRRGRAAALLVVLILALVGTPTVLLTTSLASDVVTGFRAFEAGTLSVPTPNDSVAGWPVIGPQLHAAWTEAAADSTTFIAEHRQQLRSIARWAMGAAGSSVATLLFFTGAFIIAGVMMAYAESGTGALERLVRRAAGEERGQRLHTLSVATTRSVAAGVVGVAFIQAVLFGAGFLLAGIPAAGLLALAALILGIVQLPALVFTLPAIAWLWVGSDHGTVANVAFTVYFLAAGLADNILKPLLLGRGVDAPMPVILLGAIGGMVSSGLMGLFTGAVLLATGYQLLMAWVDRVPADAGREPAC